jgi:hypothetical protein
MRGTRAKVIRKRIYGDLSIRDKGGLVATKDNPGTGLYPPGSTRRKYQDEKRRIG